MARCDSTLPFKLALWVWGGGFGGRLEEEEAFGLGGAFVDFVAIGDVEGVEIFAGEGDADEGLFGVGFGEDAEEVAGRGEDLEAEGGGDVGAAGGVDGHAIAGGDLGVVVGGAHVHQLLLVGFGAVGGELVEGFGFEIGEVDVAVGVGAEAVGEAEVFGDGFPVFVGEED